MSLLTDTRRRFGSDRLVVGLALFAVYVVWGSTYLGLRFGLEGFPPFLMGGIRFAIAGGILYAFALRNGGKRPSLVEWRNSAAIGLLMFMGGVGLVTIAQDNGIGSGLAASAVAVMPLWAALWSGLFGRWPTRLEWAGLVVGFAGVVLLSQEGDFQGTLLGTTLIVIAPIFWSLGSVMAPRLELPDGVMGTAAQMLTGSVALLVAGFVRGETIDSAPNLTSWLALGYLITFGSIVAFGSYMYLLRNTRPAVATSYAYVNPVVAIVLGVTLGEEIISGWALVGLPVILVGVGLVGVAQRIRSRKAGTSVRAPKVPRHPRVR